MLIIIVRYGGKEIYRVFSFQLGSSIELVVSTSFTLITVMHLFKVLEPVKH